MIQPCFRKTGFLLSACLLVCLPATSFSQSFFNQTFNQSYSSQFFDHSVNSVPNSFFQSAPAPAASLSLVGPDTICAGQRDTLSIDFTDGMPPYVFFYSINGIPQTPDTTNSNPYIFLTPPLSAGTAVIRLDSLIANDSIGTVAGQDTITVLPAPTATLQSDTINLCFGATDTLRITFEGPGPYTFQYAVNLDTMPAITTSDTIFLIPIMPPVGQNIYRLISVNGGSCDGVVQGIYDVTVADIPTANLTGDTTICPGQSTFLSFSFTGNQPYIINYTADGIPQTPDTSFFNPRTLLVTPGEPTVYEITGMSSGGCPGTGSGQANVDLYPALTAEISGGGQICQGGAGTSITFTFTGPGPYTFVYRAGLIDQPPIRTNSNPYVLPVNPQNGTIYRLVSVTNGVCTGTVSGIAVVAVFTPSTAELIGDLTFCESADTTLMVDFTGSGPFVLVYSVDGVLQDTVETFDDPYFIPVNITTTTVYELVSVESPGCMGSVTGTLTVTINYPPTYENLNITCDLSAGTYVVEFDVLGATLPLTLVNGNGSFSGAHFTSDPISVLSGYDFSFHDANLCMDIIVSGISICNCTSDAGTMDLSPISSCTGATATAIHNGDQILDNNDTLLFILHTNPGTPIGQIIAWSATPSFSYGPGIITGVTYYISPIAGDPDLMGMIDLMDPCLSVGTGTPVVWHVSPTATINAAFDICPGDQVLIPVVFTGQAPFTLTYTNNGASTMVLALQNSFSISATLLDTAIYQAVSVSNALCPGTATGQAVVNVHPAPQIVNVNAVCAPDNLTYTLEFDVLEADPGSLSVAGSVTGNFDPATGHFTSDPIPAQTPYTAQVTDSWLCGIDSISGGANCACVTSAGILDQTPQVLCNADTALLALSSGVFLDPNDSLLYVLVTGTSPVSWNILGVNTIPRFGFDPATMVTGVPYFIAAIAGNIDPTTGVDLNDPCFSYSLGASVIWQEVGTVVLGADTQICQGDTATLQLVFSGAVPYNFIYQINNIDQPALSAASSPYLLKISPASSSTYTLSSATANGCPATVSGSADVVVNAVPQILDTVTTCDFNTLNYTLEFKVSNGPAPNLMYTVSGLQGSFTDSVFQSVPIPSGQQYNVTVSTPAGCTAVLSGTASCACMTKAGSFASVEPQDICIPGSANIQPIGNAVLGPDDALQYIVYENLVAFPSGVLAVSNTPQFAFTAGMVAGTTYYISAVAGNILPNGTVDLTDPCLSISLGVPVVFRQPPTATLSGDTTICIGGNTIFKIFFTGKSPFQFVYSVNGTQQTAVSAPQNSFTISTNNVQQQQLFQLISVQDAYCTGTAAGTYTVNVQARPKADLVSDTSICSGDNAQLTLHLSGAINFDVTINGGAMPIQLTGVQDGATFSVAPTGTTTYSIGAFSAQGNTCAAEIGTNATVTVAPPLMAVGMVSDFGGFNVSCPNDSDGSIGLNVSGGILPVNVLWSNGVTGYFIQNLSAGTYNVTLTDNLGCSLQDSFTLIAPEALQITMEAYSPVCFGERNGIISIQNIQGGAGPFAISLNGLPGQTADTFPINLTNLTAGAYSLSVEDLNGCVTILDTTLIDPPLLTVELGPDIQIYPGGNALLEPVITGTALDTFAWAANAGSLAPTTLSATVEPSQATNYTLWVQDTAGCRAEDIVRVFVRNEYRLYVPNAIQPGAAAPNDMLTIYAGPEVVNIHTFRIYDRWGGNVFEGLDITPNNPAQGWNGKWNGKDVQPGVFVWVVELELIDGTTDVKSGSVTVLR